MERLIARLVAALNTGAHLLVTDVAGEFPAGSRHLLNFHYWFHEGVISEGDLGDPHGTQQMRPLG